MTYDPTHLPPEPPLDEPDDGYPVGWRRNGVGSFCSPGDRARAITVDQANAGQRHSRRGQVRAVDHCPGYTFTNFPGDGCLHCKYAPAEHKR